MQKHSEAEAARLIADWCSETVPQATSYRDTSPVRPTGAQPVIQPGRTPMSQRASDISGVLLAAGLASVPIGGMAALVLYTVGQIDPVNLAIGAGAPLGLVLAVGVAARMLGRAVREGTEGVARAGAAMPPGQVHTHYHGPSHVENRHLHVTTDARWLGRAHNEIQN